VGSGTGERKLSLLHGFCAWPKACSATSPIGSGVSELRIHHGPGYRVYFQRLGDARILLLCGGDKASQSRDIAKAKRLAEKWKEPNA
jgi:putative addiction module killer protein